MPNKKITDYNALTIVDPSNDLLEIVDVSETDPNNKNKKITPQNLIGGTRLDQLGEPIDNTNLDVNTSRHGLMKKLSGIATQFFNGLGQWIQVKDTDLNLQDEITSNASSARHGFLPKLSSIATQFLNGFGYWAQVKDTDLNLQDETTSNATTSRHGFLPKLSGISSQFLNGIGQWATPSSGGGGGSYQQPFLFPRRSNINSGTITIPGFDNYLYNHFGVLCVNPITGTMVWVYRNGFSHISNNATIRLIKSTNGGATWSSPVTIFSQTDYDLRNCGGGYTKSGRLIIFYGKYYLASTWVAIAYRYSDDDGQTWSSEQTINPQGNNAYSPFGQIVEDENGHLYQTWYGIYTPTLTYSVYVAKSTDNGVTWTTNYQVYSGTTKCTEASLTYLGGGKFLLLSRIDGGSTMQQFLSNDYCQTWINQGATSFETWTPQSNGMVPMPNLQYIDYNGIGIVACYYTLRSASPQLLKVVYGLATSLINGPSGWVASTIRTVHTYSSIPTANPGYQTFYHPDNKFRGIGITCEEQSDSYSWPIVVFSPTSITNILTSLGV